MKDLNLTLYTNLLKGGALIRRAAFLVFIAICITSCNGSSAGNTSNPNPAESSYYLGTLNGSNGATVWSSSSSFTLSNSQSTSGVIMVISTGYNFSGFMDLRVVSDNGPYESTTLPTVNFMNSLCDINLTTSHSCEYVINSSESVINGNYSIIPTFTLTSTEHDTKQQLNSIGLTIANGTAPNPGNLVIIPQVESLIPNESTSAVISLSGSVGIFESIAVNITSSNSNLLSVNPSTCNLKTSNNNCTVTLTAVSEGTTNIVVSASGYNPIQTTVNIIHPRSYVYVANSIGTISMYAIDPNNGLLFPLTPSTVTSSLLSQHITVDPTGKYVYINDYSGGKILMYAINPNNGLLVPLSPPSIVTDTKPNSIAIDYTGRYFYVVTDIAAEPTITISMYSLASNTGLLSPLTPNTVPAGLNITNIVTSPHGGYLYALDAILDPTILMYSIESGTGLLAPLSPESSVNTGKNPQRITISPKNYAYVTNSDDNTISSYSIESNGALKLIGNPVATGQIPIGIITDSSGQYLYVTNFGDNTVSMYSINSNTGLPTPLRVSTVRSGSSPWNIIVDPTSNYVYVTNRGDNTVSMYRINQTTGVLTPLNLASISTDIAPFGIITATPDGAQ